MSIRKPRAAIFAALTAGLAVTGLALSSSAPAGASHLSLRPGAGPSRAAGVRATTATPGFAGFTNTFKSGTGNFCNNSADAPCDGNAVAGDYGTVDNVPVTFSNGGFGNYAPGGAGSSPTSFSHYVVLSGTTAANQGLGCQTPGTEGCTGPYAEQNSANRPQYGFPSNGYTVTAYQYIDPSYDVAHGTQIDTDLGINQVTGPATVAYGSDNVITACNDAGGTSLSFGHGSPGTCGNGDQITSAQWVREVFLVTNVGGKVFITARVLNENGTSVLFDSGPQAVSFDGGVTQATTSTTGGLRYLWWPTLNVSGLPVGFVKYQAGQVQNGSAA